ncbi:hypothetical protein HYT56_03555 [Candidatus Woesearchaeota archaeon]|nr:hypothetical protein [Candidatus Woesearchaeota archaeon]
MSKKSKREAYFILAQILAILSGSLFVVAGFFINASANYHSAIQTNNELIYQVKTIEPNALPYLRESNNLLGKMQLSAYNYFKWFLIIGGLVSLGSLIAWFRGYKSK